MFGSLGTHCTIQCFVFVVSERCSTYRFVAFVQAWQLLKVEAIYVRFAVLVQPLHQRIDGTLFVLDSDLFDFGVGAFVAMVEVVFAISAF